MSGVIRRADTVVVGAGLAGLSAARELRAAGAGVVVLEARKRVGGRTLTEDVGGVPVEMGGQWIGPAQRRINALAEELGVGTVPADVPGRVVLWESGRRSEYAEGEDVPLREPEAFREAEEAFRALGELAREVPAEAPWAAPGAEEWDGQTLGTWRGRYARSAGARFWFDLAVQSLYACEPRELSLLGVLADVAASGSFAGLFEIEASVEESVFLGGAQEVSVRMAAELEESAKPGEPGGRVVLGSPVRRISQSADGVLVESDRAVVEAGAAIVAVPPVLRGRIEYEPALPAAQDAVSQRMPMGAVIKCHAVYERPFWRDAGLSGRAESDAGPCKVTMDNSPPDDGPGGGPGVMTGFILGRDAREWGARPAEERRAAMLGAFARFFGEEALRPRAYAELDWNAEVYSRGGYGGYAPPGFLTDGGAALRKPVGRVYWAGTETATEWGGYMDAPVQSGRRAAREALARLGTAGGRSAKRRTARVP